MKHVAGWVFLGVVAVAALGLYGREQRARGRAEAQLVELRQANDSLAKAQRKVDTIYLRDTLRLRFRRIEWDTVRVRDTIVRNDTVFVPRAVADSVISACTSALRTCEQRAQLWADRYANLELQVAAMPKPRAAWKVWGERITLVVGTAAVCSAGR